MATLASATPVISRYEPVIGLEVHVQLNTRTKIFCGCTTTFGAAPNTQTCPVCLGLPGALPVLNREVVNKAVRAALGLQCNVHETSIFARKNYFYPDLPKGYQISQHDRPLAEGGVLEIAVSEVKGEAEGEPQWKRIGITRLHVEEDAGKNLHQQAGDHAGFSGVDLNRAGVPLVEIVSEPDLRSPEEAFEYLTRLKEIMLYLGVSDCNMEEGSLRCDANVSLRPQGTAAFGAKVEVKNLNSFRYLQKALEFEIERQAARLDAGETIPQETRSYDAAEGRTFSMRSKEMAHDYRYFPEPDLPPLVVGAGWRADLAAGLPELPRAKRERLRTRYGISGYLAGVLTASQALADYFEEAAAHSANPTAVANWIMGELSAGLNARGETPATVKVRPRHIAELVSLIDDGVVSGKMAKDVFAEMLPQGEAPVAVIERHGWRQITDTAALETILDKVIADNPAQTAQYRAGKTTLLAFFVGQAMKATQGKANPAQVNELLKRKLG